jgi:hypothetical protein
MPLAGTAAVFLVTRTQKIMKRWSRSSYHCVTCNPGAWLVLAAALACVSPVFGGEESDQADRSAAAAESFASDIAPLLKRHCARCHGAEKPEADFQLHDLTADFTQEEDAVRWEKILEMVSLGDMPPPDEAQPLRVDRRRLTRWVGGQLSAVGRGASAIRAKLPTFGNRVNHEELFSGAHRRPAFTYPRLWRIYPDIYEGRMNGLRLGRSLSERMKSSLATLDGRGFNDYAMVHADEATFSALLTNAESIAQQATTGKGAPLAYFTPQRDGELPEPDEALRRRAIEGAFEALFERVPSEEELARYEEFLVQSMELTSPQRSYQTMLKAMLMSGEFVFRMELGLGESLEDGRRLLSPRETAYALAYAITDTSPDSELMNAAENGRLATREDAAREARRMLAAQTRDHWCYRHHQQGELAFDDPNNPRVLRFFREFFGYHRALDVFKDEPHRKLAGVRHEPHRLVLDADMFVLEILERDRDVLRQLLTSDRYFVLFKSDKTLKKKGVSAKLSHKDGYISHYNLDYETWDWRSEANQPFQQPVPRAGMLTHPAWLVAWSENFDNDPIRRGKWIREHLLADSVPELPLDAQVMLPSDPHLTLRERLEVTKAKECWRCHRQMNPLGVAFEAYNDFGVYREQIPLGDIAKHHKAKAEYDQRKEQLERELAKRLPTKEDGGNKTKIAQVKQQLSELVEPVAESKPVDDSGVLEGTGDPQLDGPYEGASQLMQRLARSDRVRQSFLRHMFRYWMGRNEMLSDSPTLMAMDRTYLESGGSFKETLVTLLSSDSFLCRKEPVEE